MRCRQIERDIISMQLNSRVCVHAIHTHTHTHTHTHPHTHTHTHTPTPHTHTHTHTRTHTEVKSCSQKPGRISTFAGDTPPVFMYACTYVFTYVYKYVCIYVCLCVRITYDVVCVYDMLICRYIYVQDGYMDVTVEALHTYV
jgi:hypothetical protein